MTPHPIIPQTREQATQRDHLAQRRGEHDPEHSTLAKHGELRIVQAHDGLALQRHHHQIPLTPAEHEWLTSPAVQALFTQPE